MIVLGEVHLDQVGLLLNLNRDTSHLTFDSEEAIELLVPEGQIVPEERNVPKVVGLITGSQEAMIVKVSWQEGLPGHIHEVILHVELEVDLFVVACGFFAWLAQHQDLQSVLARLQVDPNCLRRLVLIKLEDLFVLLIIVIIFIFIVALDCMMSCQQVVPFTQVQLHNLVVKWTVEYFYK